VRRRCHGKLRLVKGLLLDLLARNNQAGEGRSTTAQEKQGGGQLGRQGEGLKKIGPFIGSIDDRHVVSSGHLHGQPTGARGAAVGAARVAYAGRRPRKACSGWWPCPFAVCPPRMRDAPQRRPTVRCGKRQAVTVSAGEWLVGHGPTGFAASSHAWWSRGAAGLRGPVTGGVVGRQVGSEGVQHFSFSLFDFP
jgi:hypothetical protein